MKATPTLLTTAALTLSLCSTYAGDSDAEVHGDPYIPVGSLDVKYNYVRSGKKARLKWDISYPVTASGLVTMNQDGQLTTTEDVVVTVRVVGVDGDDPVSLFISTDSSGWDNSFVGSNADVKPNKDVFEKTVRAGNVINIAASVKDEGETWLAPRSTTVSDPSVIGLADQDEPPSYDSSFVDGDIAPYLTAYFVGKNNNGHGNNEDGVDSSNKGQGSGGPNGEVDTSVDEFGNIYDDEIKHHAILGPKEMIYLFDLDSSGPGDPFFKMQDLAVVITFEPV